MIEYRTSPEGITPEMLQGFFQGWKRPHTPESHLRILLGSDRVVLAIDTGSNRVVRFVTAIPVVDLACDPPLQPFYGRFGMQPLVGMGIRNRGNGVA